MTKKAIYIILLSFSMVHADWDLDILPLSQVKPGMEGTGKTIFYGDSIDEFGVTVLDIMENFYPHRDVIIVRLSGEMAEKTGVMAGMSGSPIYIDGKLVGALAYRIGQFMKEPIAGVMPIEEMLQIPPKEKQRSAKKGSTATALLPSYLEASLVGARDDFWRNIIETIPVAKTSGSIVQVIQTPLSFSGFDQGFLSQYFELFSSMGFVPIISGGGSGSSKSSKSSNANPFQPGSAVAQVLIKGDYNIDATGTVTAVSGNQLLAFGHYAFNLGDVNMPLAKTKVIASLPSMMASNKMAVATEIVGSIRQDRMSGILGDLSIEPEMVPVDVLHSSALSGDHSYHFEMAADPSMSNLMPFYLRIAIIQALTSARLAGELNSIEMDATINMENGSSVRMQDFFSSRQVFGFFGTGMDAASVGDLIASALGVLMVNDFNSPKLKSINIRTKEVPGQNYARIQSVWQDKTEIDPGDSLFLSIKLQQHDGKTKKLSAALKVPKNINANSLSIIISSAPTLTAYEMNLTPDKFRPVDYEHLLEILNSRRMNKNIYIQVRLRDSGLIVEGKELSELPPSIIGIMDSRRSSGVSRRLADRVLFEQAIPTDFQITGAKRLSVRINSPQKALVPREKDQKDTNEALTW